MKIDVYPKMAQYYCGDIVTLIIENNDKDLLDKEIVCEVYVKKLHNIVQKKRFVLHFKDNIYEVDLDRLEEHWEGYGVEVYGIVDDEVIFNASTAFDILDHWTKAPRYGFLSEFYTADEKDIDDIKQMRKYHINLVQFYDWMYRHDNLIPNTKVFSDVLGRELSLEAVKDKINGCHKYNMKAIAYGAIYAASKEFFNNHKGWGLYNNKGESFDFIDLFNIMDISKDSNWSKHIINEYKKAIELLDFDGIHMDTYGFPKTAFRKNDENFELVNLGEQYPDFIDMTYDGLKNCKKDIHLLFNAVSNWAIEDIKKSQLEIAYIEVWDPQENYIHLNNLIQRAKDLGFKNVILAAYLKFFNKENDIDFEKAFNSFKLTSSVIFASGGFHLLLGENNGILADPYYVNYGSIPNELYERVVRNYYDFNVRYSTLLYHPENRDITMTYTGGINGEYKFNGNCKFTTYGESNKVWTIIKENPNYKIIHLINLTNNESTKWNEVKEKPVEQQDISVEIMIDEKIKGIYLASPDINNCSELELNYDVIETERGRGISFNIPKLYIWDMIYIELN